MNAVSFSDLKHTASIPSLKATLLEKKRVVISDLPCAKDLHWSGEGEFKFRRNMRTFTVGERPGFVQYNRLAPGIVYDPLLNPELLMT